MYSSLVELAGFSAITDGVYRLAGPGWGFICGGLLAVILGISINDNAIKMSLKIAGRASIRKMSRLTRFRSKSLPSRVSPHPPLVVDETTQQFAEQAARSAEARLRLAQDGESFAPYAVQ